MAALHDVPAAELHSGILGGWAAGSDLSSSQFLFVTMSAGTIAVATSGFPIGILANAPESGEMGSIKVNGIYVLTVDGSGTAISIGDPIKPTTGGKGIKAASNNDRYRATALEASTGSSDEILVLLADGYVGA